MQETDQFNSCVPAWKGLPSLCVCYGKLQLSLPLFYGEVDGRRRNRALVKIISE